MIDPSGDDHCYAHDHLFSPVALLASDGTVEERYEYDAYGKMTRLDPDFTAWSGTPAGNPYYFTGQSLDELDSGSLLIMYYKNRYYLVDLGRFIQRDPTRYRDGMNLYEYVRSRPIVALDELGLFTIEAIGTPRYRHPKGYHFDPETRCVDSFWMGIALRLDGEEEKKISDAGGGMAVMRKHARWKQWDCRDGKLSSDGSGSDTATFLRNPAVTTKAAGSGAIMIDSLDGDSPDFGIPWKSAFYSALIHKGFGLKSRCCSRGFIDVTAQFLIYAGKSPFSGGRPPDGSTDGRISNDYAHMPHVPGWANPGKGIIPIATGYIKVNVSWDCKQKVKGTIKSNVEYNDADSWNTRYDRDEDWYRYSIHSSSRDPDTFPILFEKN